MGYQPRHRAGMSQRNSKKRKILRILMILTILLMIVYPFAEPFMLETETVTLLSTDLPTDVNALRIVYLSDIHQGAFYSKGRVKELVSKVNALNPDIILLGGDYASDAESAIDFFRTSPAFHARYAVCAIMGDTDRLGEEGSLGQLKAAMFSAGVTPLVNELSEIRIGTGSSVWVAGLDDSTNGTPDVAALAAETKQKDYVILLGHSPTVIPEALNAESRDGLKNWFDLGLFGHTHGTQIALLGRILGIGTDVERRYESGWLQENRIDLLVSRGIGAIKLPVRLFRRPQIHLIIVRKD